MTIPLGEVQAILSADTGDLQSGLARAEAGLGAVQSSVRQAGVALAGFEAAGAGAARALGGVRESAQAAAGPLGTMGTAMAGLQQFSGHFESTLRSLQTTVVQTAGPVDALEDRARMLNEEWRTGILDEQAYAAALRQLKADIAETAAATKTGTGEMSRLSAIGGQVSGSLRGVSTQARRSIDGLEAVGTAVNAVAMAATRGAGGIAAATGSLQVMMLGNPVMIGILGGLGAIAMAWGTISEAIKGAREEAEKERNANLGRVRSRFPTEGGVGPGSTFLQLSRLAAETRRRAALELARLDAIAIPDRGAVVGGFVGVGHVNERKVNEALERQRVLREHINALIADAEILEGRAASKAIELVKELELAARTAGMTVPQRAASMVGTAGGTADQQQTAAQHAATAVARERLAALRTELALAGLMGPALERERMLRQGVGRATADQAAALVGLIQQRQGAVAADASLHDFQGRLTRSLEEYVRAAQEAKTLASPWRMAGSEAAGVKELAIAQMELNRAFRESVIDREKHPKSYMPPSLIKDLEILKASLVDISGVIEGAVTRMAAAIGEGLAKGGNFFKVFARGAIAAVGSIISALGEMLIAKGIADIFRALPFAGPAAIAVGAGLVALGAAMGASGGGVSSPRGGGGGAGAGFGGGDSVSTESKGNITFVFPRGTVFDPSNPIQMDAFVEMLRQAQGRNMQIEFA